MSMNSFNNIKKYKYEKNQKDIVSLVEYIIFEDERNNEKYLVFKFQNNVNQYLNEIKFEISQYDSENNLISTSDKLETGANSHQKSHSTIDNAIALARFFVKRLKERLRICH